MNAAQQLLIFKYVSRESSLLVSADPELGHVEAARSPLAQRSEKLRPQSSSAATSLPSTAVRCAAGELSPKVATLLAYSSHSALRGEMNASPHGKFPNAPGLVNRPSSAIASRPLRSKTMLDPSGQDNSALSAALSRSATRRDRRARPPRSPFISRPNMSAVTPGRVAPRAPATVAALRACVWLNENNVGAMKTSQAASAAATVGGGSAP